jgi:hypothetical protein
MTGAAFHSLAEEMCAAFMGEMMTVSKSERIIELAGAQWVGVQDTDYGPLVMFRDPVTGSTLALPEDSFPVADVVDRMLEARARFGVKP